MKKLKIFWTLLTIFILLIQNTSAGDIAIIVNRGNNIDNLTFKELIKIFRREKKYWKDGTKIYLVIQEAGSSEREIVLKKIYKMDDYQLKKYWLNKIYQGEMVVFPLTLSSNEAIKRFVSHIPNAISFIDSESLDETVKVLKIDGKLPGDTGYILSEEPITEEKTQK